LATNTYLDESGTWAIGMFRSDTDVFGDDTGDGFESAVTGRITRLFGGVESGERRYLHVGAAYSCRGANDQRVRFAAQPEARLGSHAPNVPLMVDTGYFAARYFQEVGCELAWVHDRFTIQSECVVAPTASQHDGTLWFQGGYVMATCLLTGEYRPYNRANGTFQRVIPLHDFARYQGPPADRRTECGPGAWEIAMRVSHLDLDDDSVRGGQLTDFTLGLNWYLNPYLRYTFNYIRAVADYPPAGSRPQTDVFGVRLGFDY
jgi:phosphate-selective porin OprO/OprP